MDTYTAQASVGDVNKAIANHKVIRIVLVVKLMLMELLLFRTSNLRTFPYLYLEMAMAEEGLYLK